jgi:hypothetical protein
LLGLEVPTTEPRPWQTALEAEMRPGDRVPELLTVQFDDDEPLRRGDLVLRQAQVAVLSPRIAPRSHAGALSPHRVVDRRKQLETGKILCS